MAEWSNAAVLKTVEGHTSGGSNPSFSAKENLQQSCGFFLYPKASKTYFCNWFWEKNQKITPAILGFHDCIGFLFRDARLEGVNPFHSYLIHQSEVS